MRKIGCAKVLRVGTNHHRIALAETGRSVHPGPDQIARLAAKAIIQVGTVIGQVTVRHDGPSVDRSRAGGTSAFWCVAIVQCPPLPATTMGMGRTEVVSDFMRHDQGSPGISREIIISRFQLCIAESSGLSDR